MTTEDTSQIPLFSPEDKKEVLRVSDHSRKHRNLKATHIKWTGFHGKTLWDWLQLLGTLAIPLVVVGATIAFNTQQANLAQRNMTPTSIAQPINRKQQRCKHT